MVECQERRNGKRQRGRGGANARAMARWLAAVMGTPRCHRPIAMRGLACAVRGKTICAAWGFVQCGVWRSAWACGDGGDLSVRSVTVRGGLAGCRRRSCVDADAVRCVVGWLRCWSSVCGCGLSAAMRCLSMWLPLSWDVAVVVPSVVFLDFAFLRFNELLTRARARLELRSGGIHVNFV